MDLAITCSRLCEIEKQGTKEVQRKSTYSLVAALDGLRKPQERSYCKAVDGSKIYMQCLCSMSWSLVMCSSSGDLYSSVGETRTKFSHDISSQDDSPEPSILSRRYGSMLRVILGYGKKSLRTKSLRAGELDDTAGVNSLQVLYSATAWKVQAQASWRLLSQATPSLQLMPTRPCVR